MDLSFHRQLGVNHCAEEFKHFTKRIAPVDDAEVFLRRVASHSEAVAPPMARRLALPQFAGDCTVVRGALGVLERRHVVSEFCYVKVLALDDPVDWFKEDVPETWSKDSPLEHLVADREAFGFMSLDDDHSLS